MNKVINRKMAAFGTVGLLIIAIVLLFVPGITAQVTIDHVGLPINGFIQPQDCQMLDGQAPPGVVSLDEDSNQIKIKYDKDGNIKEFRCKLKDVPNPDRVTKVYSSSSDPTTDIECYARGMDPKTGRLAGLQTTNWVQTLTKNGKATLTCWPGGIP